jgi:hypothetical protein
MTSIVVRAHGLPSRRLARADACGFLRGFSSLLRSRRSEFSSNRATIASSVLFLLLAFGLKRYADREVDTAIRWLRGARAETSVGEVLNNLRYEGSIVLHDIEQRGEGNVDHLVSGPTGVFMVETKERRYEDHHLAKAKRQAAKIHDELGVWVTPVICIQRRGGRPFKTHGVWIVPEPSLLDWIRAQRNTPGDFKQLARYADGL